MLRYCSMLWKTGQHAGLAGAVAVSALLIFRAGVYTGLYRVDGSVCI